MDLSWHTKKKKEDQSIIIYKDQTFVGIKRLFHKNLSEAYTVDFIVDTVNFSYYEDSCLVTSSYDTNTLEQLPNSSVTRNLEE